jgi:hypothetical protein
MLSSVQSHVLEALTNTTVEFNNYEYLCIKNLFPEEFYAELKSLPMPEVSKKVHEVFVNEDFVKLLFEKFKASPKRSEVIKSIYAFWQSHGVGYTLKPHVDSFPRVFTMTVYLADNDDAPNAGTAVYEVNSSTKEYKTVGMMPYLRNSCMIICPYEKLTWHGVDMLTDDISRDSVVVVFSAQEWNDKQMHYADWKPGVTVNYGIH